MQNISREDYIIFDKIKNVPVEKLDIVYHYSTIIELINDGFILGEEREFVSLVELPLELQREINQAIEATK